MFPSVRGGYLSDKTIHNCIVFLLVKVIEKDPAEHNLSLYSVHDVHWLRTLEDVRNNLSKV